MDASPSNLSVLDLPLLQPIITGIGETQECLITLAPGQSISVVGYGLISIESGEVYSFGSVLTSKHKRIPFFSPECYSLLVFSSSTSSASSIIFYEGSSNWLSLTSFLDMKDIWGDGSSMKSLKSKYSEIYSIFKSLHLIALKDQETILNISFLTPLPLWRDICNFLPLSTSPSVVVFGPKGSGKSSFLKFCINSFLSNSLFQKSDLPCRILFMNLDCGQSEFGPPAMVSLHLIDFFVLGPSFTTQLQPMHQEFIGIISISDDPRGYLHAVEKLCRFLHYRAPKGYPLLVNTMGWTAGLGLEIFKCIVQMIKPSFIVPLLENVRDAEDLSSNPLVKDSIQRLSSTLSEPLYFKIDHFQLTKNYHPTILPTSATAIPPPGNSTSKYSPKDLRSLILLSYFNLNREIFSPIYCMLPLNVSFSKVNIFDASRALAFDCTVVGLFHQSEFLGMGFIRAVDMNKNSFHLVIPPLLLESIQQLTAISRSTLNIHPREYYDAFTKTTPTIYDDQVIIVGGSNRKVRHSILRRRPNE